MAPTDLLEEAHRNLRGAGFGALRELFWRTYLRHGRTMRADPVFEADWDLLVVLDACRADLWASVVDDRSLPVGTTRVSPGGTSTEWLDAVFGETDPAALADVGYVTANPYSESHTDETALGPVEEVWRYGWDEQLRTTPPEAVTEAAVRVARENDPGRLVVHYMQPHFPAVRGDIAGEGGVARDAFGEESLSIWEDLRFGTRSAATVWEAYRENLEAVLPHVETLLSNVDAERAVITADHGNAFGERGLYGHVAGVALRPLREVPWVVTEATDEGTLDVEERDDRPADVEADVEQRLRDLGYR